MTRRPTLAISAAIHADAASVAAWEAFLDGVPMSWWQP